MPTQPVPVVTVAVLTTGLLTVMGAGAVAFVPKAVSYFTVAALLHDATVVLPAPRESEVTVRLAAKAVTAPKTTTPTATGRMNFFTGVLLAFWFHRFRWGRWLYRDR